MLASGNHIPDTSDSIYQANSLVQAIFSEDSCLFNALARVDEPCTKAATITEEITINILLEAVVYSTNFTVSF